MLITIVICFLCTFLLCIYRMFNVDRKCPPGPKWIPFIGSSLYFKRHCIREQLQEYALKYGNLFQVQLLDTNIIVLDTVEMINKTFTNEGKLFNHRPSLFVGNKLGLLESISFRDNDRGHSLQKKVFTKLLLSSGSGCADFETKFQGEIQRVIDEIDSQADSGFEVIGILHKWTLNVMSILLTGSIATDQQCRQIVDLTSGEDFFLNAFTNTLLSTIPSVVNLPYYKRRLNKLLTAKASLQESYFNDVKGRDGEIRSNAGFVHRMLLEQEKNTGNEEHFSDEVLKAIIITDVLSAGTLTTASVLPCIILCLVNHPDIQTKLQQELDNVVGSDRPPDIRDKSSCHFTQAVIMETLRYITPNPFWLPHTCKQDVVFEGFHIPANSQIIANSQFIHHDEGIWGDPWTFRPDRFLGEDDKLLPTDHIYIKSWIPFGVGRRRCPGMEFATSRIFLFVANLFHKYTLSPVPGKCGTCDPRSDDFVFDLLLKPKPFYCYARKRCVE